MRISRGFTTHGAQAESLGGVIAGGLDPPIVESQDFGAATL